VERHKDHRHVRREREILRKVTVAVTVARQNMTPTPSLHTPAAAPLPAAAAVAAAAAPPPPYPSNTAPPPPTLPQLSSPFCIKLFGTLQDPTHIYLALELAAGGELFRRLSRKVCTHAHTRSHTRTDAHARTHTHTHTRAHTYRSNTRTHIPL